MRFRGKGRKLGLRDTPILDMQLHSQTEAAAILGVDRKTLYRKLEEAYPAVQR